MFIRIDLLFIKLLVGLGFICDQKNINFTYQNMQKQICFYFYIKLYNIFLHKK